MQKNTHNSRYLTIIAPVALLTFAIQPAQADLTISSHAPDLADLSGERGNNITSPVELSRGKAGTAITLIMRNDVSCGVALEGRKLGANANFETQKLDRCSTGKGRESDDTLDVGVHEHIVGLRVCNGRTSPFGIGGYEIDAREIDDDGLLNSSGGASDITGGDCDRWGIWSSCPDNFVVTGFVAHFARSDRSDDLPDALTGLQAVCREVLVR